MKIFDIILKLEAEFHLHEDILEWQPLLTGGSTNLKYYGITKSGLKFNVKYQVLSNRNLQQRKIRNLLNLQTNLIFPRCICSYISLSSSVCFITEWIEGENLQLGQLNFNIDSLYMCVKKVCVQLKTLHSISVDMQPTNEIRKDYKKACATIKHYKIKIPHLDMYCNYIDTHIMELSSKRLGYVHFDFHPGNILQVHKGYRIIDLETISITDVWRDLVYAVAINFPIERKFWLLFLLEYFEGLPPKEFFSVSKLYVIIYMLMLAKSNYKNKTTDTYFQLAEKLYNDYQGLKTEIPSWFYSTAKELVQQTDLFHDELNILANSEGGD